MKYKTILEALKSGKECRITSGNNKWMYWDENTSEWVVREQGYRKKKSIELFRGKSEQLAINILFE